MIKFWISPLSVQIIDAAVEVCNKRNSNVIGFIISKNQVWDNGYTGFNNESLINTLNEKFKHRPPVFRDHSNCNTDDLEVDCETLNGIHIDPFYKGIDNPIEQTRLSILYCESINSNLQYEIGTEEARWPYNYYYLDDFLRFLKIKLSNSVFEKIKYVVIQCGTALKNGTNKSIIDYGNLKAMYEVCKKYGKTPKQHNSDYLSNKILKQQSDVCGRSLSINVAPEIGTIQSLAVYDSVNNDLKHKFYNLVLKNPNTSKWFDENFDFYSHKRLVVGACGHYVYNTQEFVEIFSESDKASIHQNLTEYLTSKIMSLS